MTTYRTDIEKALDEIISNEEGMRFQGLAVVLAKLKWPEFIASERHNDLGLDAYIPASCASDNREKGLASSITPTIGKIKEDIERFQPHYPNIKILIFATPHKVTNQQAESWKETIWRDCNIELQIISREDVITDLLLPDHASICLSHLNIHVAVELTTRELAAKAQEAKKEVLAAWLAHPRLAGKPQIELRSVSLDNDGHQIGEIFSLISLSQMLQEGRRIVLEAPAGRGKTITLIQLAERMNQVTFLIDLPTWVKSDKDIFEFISQMPPFLSRRLDATALAQIYNTTPCSFLLNGWNEISDIYSDKAVSALLALERNFPKAGIIVATRAHHIKPPLPGSSRVQLLSLNRKQRAEYLNQVLASRAEELISQLQTDHVLDDLTRTPLILSEVVNIFLSGSPIPQTKTGILEAVVHLTEESEEHRNHLARSPLLGKSRDYLSDFAFQMTKVGTVTMDETFARSFVNSVSRKLQAEEQIAMLPEPAEVLNALCAHHVLERLDYSSVAFRFQHQQFQEWYVSIVLRRSLLEIVDNNNQEMNRNFIRQYINMPLWEESLRMIAEDIGGLNANSSNTQTLVKAGSMLVEFTLEVDPVFATELARLCGNAVWLEVKDKVGQCLRSWYQAEEDSHKRCALAGMFASGSEDFKDILLPLLTSDDQQVRLRAYRSFREFHVSSLGENWKQTIKSWKDDYRADFIGEVVHDYCMVGVAEDFARTDASAKVRASALRALEWVGAVEILSSVLAAYEDNVFEEVLRERMINDIPPKVRPRANKVYGAILKKIDDPKVRLRVLLATADNGGDHIVESVKGELTKWPSGRMNDGEESFIKSAIELVRKNDPDWVGRWLAERIIGGLLWSDRWITFISSLPQDFKQGLFKKISEVPLEHREKSSIVSVLVATADLDLAGDVFLRLCLLWDETLNSSGSGTGKQWDIIRQLQELFRAIPSNIAICGMLGHLSSEFNPVEYQVTVELLGRIGDTGSDLKSQLVDGLRQALRAYLKGGVLFVLSQDDFNGSLKSGLATALARAGDPEDMDDLNKLIQADIARMRRGREAWIKGDRGPEGNGGVMSYSNWQVRAVECLDSRGAEDVLLNVLSEPEYEQDAVKALIRLARISNPETQQAFRKINYRSLWEARSGRLKSNFDEDRRCRYASAIKQRIAIIKEQRSQSDNPDSFNGRLKMLASFITVLDSRVSSDLVVEIMSLPGQWDGHTRVDALEVLLFNGVLIKADEALKVLNPTIGYAISELHDQQSRFLLQRCLCLLPFFDPPSAGIARIKEIITATQIPVYDLREILNALGNSRCDEALDLLLELSSKYGNNLNHIRGEWIDAIAAVDTNRSRKALMSFVDPEIEGFKEENWHFDYHESDSLSAHIANIARNDQTLKDRLFLLCTKQLSPRARMLLANTISKLEAPESLRAGLNLIDDRKNPSIPYQLLRGLEDIFLGKRPYGSAGNIYTIESTSANEIRRLLYEMAIGDDTRKRSACVLLSQIESWRLEYGRPDNEPRHPNFDSGKPWPVIESRDKPSVCIIA
jgi:hypothetical protein